MKQLLVTVVGALCAVAVPTWSASALSLETLDGALPGTRPAPADVIAWDTLGKASVVFGEGDGAETVTTVIPPEVEALDGRQVKLMGFVFPIEAELPMRKFLLVEYPADCPFCLAAGTEPSRMVEVESDAGVDMAMEQVVLGGRLEVLRDDPEGLVYRLHDAALVK